MISEQIIMVLDDLARRFGIIIDWTAENVVPYLEDFSERFINYEITTSYMWIVSMWSIAVIGLVVFIVSAKCDWDLDARVPLGVFMIGMLFVAVVVTITQALDIIACNTIPEKIIIREIQALLNSKG